MNWPRPLLALALLAALPPAAARSSQEDSTPVTFNRDIAPILHSNCAPCHHPGGVGPFNLLTYDDAKRRARQIAAVTESGFMPPWQPKPGYGEFAGGRRLSPDQIGTIQNWAEHGAPAGDPPEPTPPEWPEGWAMGQPDLVVEMAESFTVPAEGVDVFRNFVIPIPVEESRWVKALELRPGNPKVVHHAVMQIDSDGACRALDARDPEPGFPGMDMGPSVTPEGQILSWTPGKTPRSGGDLAWKLDPGTDLILQLHMVPTGAPETIRPQVGFRFADSPPARQAVVYVLRSNQIDIPPGKRDYLVEDSVELPVDVEVVSLYPHAHYLAKEMKIYAELPGGGRRWLIWIPNWDFNWQDQYWFREPVALPAGSRIVMNYRYDNSADNVRNPNRPPRRVREGPSSSDEMANLAVQLLPRRPSDLAALVEAQLRDVVSDPDNPRTWLAHVHLGRRAEERGDFKAAADHYRKSIQAKPDDYQGHYFLAALEHRLGRFKEAEAGYRTALRLRPSGVEICNNLGALLGAQGRLDEAAEIFRHAVELDPGSPEAHFNLGNALSDLDEAVVHYRQALELRPEYAEAHNSLGIALAAQGKLEDALKHFRLAVQAKPGYVEAEKNLRIVRQRLERGH